MKNSIKTSHATLGLFTEIIGNNPQKLPYNLFLRNTKANNVKIALQINIKKPKRCHYQAFAVINLLLLQREITLFLYKKIYSKTLGITATGSAIDVKYKDYE